MALTDKLRAIGNGFRESRGTTQEYTLDEMASMAREPIGGGTEDLDEVLTEQEGVIEELGIALGAKEATTFATRSQYKQELEYLEGTGTQWIDIGTTINTSTDEIEMYFELTETNNYKWFFGEYDTNARLGLGSGDGKDKRNFLYKASTVKLTDAEMYEKKHKYTINTSGGFIDDVAKISLSNFVSVSTLYLFNLNIDSSSDYRCKAKVWSYKQSRNGVLIRDLIPVLDHNDVPCMYDKVSGDLLYNQGGGVFLYQIKTSKPTNEERIRKNNEDLREYVNVVNELPNTGVIEDLEDILLDQEAKINELLSLLEQKSVGNIKYKEKLIEAYERTNTELNIEEVKLISQYMFYNYTTLKTANFPNITSIGSYAFYNSTALTLFNAPKVATIGQYAFYNASILPKIDFLELTSAGNYCFRQCRKITNAIFPKLTSIGTYALSRCNLLEMADLGQVTTLQTQLFGEDSQLKTVILRNTSQVVSLSNINVFSGTPFASGGSGGTVYVPEALIEEYKVATNWVSLHDAGTCVFMPIEGSDYE